MVERNVNPYYESEGITIYHGDCRDVLPSLPNGSIDFVLTDPPYGHNNNDGDMASNREAIFEKGEAGPIRPITNDGKEANDLYRWMLHEAKRVLSDGCICCCCGGGGGPDPQFARWSMWMDEIFGFKHMVVWDKGPMGMGHHYRRSYEVVLVGQKPGVKCRWFDTTKRAENIVRDIPKIIPQERDHPTVKPTALMAKFIRYHTQEGHVVLDPFMGSGTTLRAAKNLRRKAIGIECDEKYCEDAVKRLEMSAHCDSTRYRMGKAPREKVRGFLDLEDG